MNNPDYSPINNPIPPLSTGKKKVLVVDDDALVVSILSSLLSESHYEVETSENGK